MDFKYDFNIGVKISLYQGKVGGGTIPLLWMFTVVVFSLGARDLHQWWYSSTLNNPCKRDRPQNRTPSHKIIIFANSRLFRDDNENPAIHIHRAS